MATAAMEFAQAMISGASPYWLTYLGSSGLGKTMLSKMITRVFRRHLDGTVSDKSEKHISRYRGGFIDWPKLCGYLRHGDYRAFDDVCRDDFVALDDLGAEQGTAFTTSKLFEFCNRRERKWTVITSNLLLDQIRNDIDARISSRMLRHGNVVIQLVATDYNER